MDTDFAVFEALEVSPGRLEKQDLLSTLTELEKVLVQLALDPDILFRIQQIPEPPHPGLGRAVNHFFELCDHLSSKRALTNEDRTKVDRFLETCTAAQQKWYRRILLKDLRCGIDAKTVNTVWPDLISTYDCALAETYDPVKHADIWQTMRYTDVKLDGIRCLATVWGNGSVAMRSRKGKLIETFPEIEAELSKLPSGIYDGEIYLHGPNGFQELMKYVKRDEPVPAEIPYRYYLFDCVEFPDWENTGRTPRVFYHHRHDDLADFLDDRFGPSKLVHEGWLVDYENATRLGRTEPITASLPGAQLFETLDSVLGLGFEGLMIKDATRPYERKRSSAILKVKRFHDLEAVVVDKLEGTGRLAGTLGALVCEWRNQRFQVGSGFTDAERARIWADPEALDRIVTVKYQELTKDGVPRFPTFLRFREDQEAGL